VVTPLQDTQVELDETVTVTLSPNAAYTVGTPGSATVILQSDDVVSVPAEIIIDNGTGGTSATGGTWPVSAGPNPWGTNSLYHDLGAASYRWTPTILTAGQYQVWVWWTVHTNRGAAVPYLVQHAGGAFNTTRNQRIGGGQWQLLGTFSFNPGTNGYVEVSASAGQASADAARFVRVDAILPTVTIAAADGLATEVGLTSGTVTVSRSGPTTAALTVNYTVAGAATAGSDYQTLAGSVVIPEGQPSAPVVVTPLQDTHVETDETVIVTLSPNGAYTVGPASSATVTIQSDDVAAPVEIVMDNGSAGTHATGGTWPVSAGLSPWGTNSLYHDLGPATYRWTPTIATPGQYEVWVWWTVHANRGTAIPYVVQHAEGMFTTTRNQRNGGGQWQLLGRFSFDAGTGGYVEVSAAAGQASADAVRFARVP
jgi:hypothetical protein